MPVYERLKMCKECPFRANAPPGWLGPLTVDDLLQTVHGPYIPGTKVHVGDIGHMICHVDIARLAAKGLDDDQILEQGQQCVGAIRYANSACKDARDPEVLDFQERVAATPDQPVIPARMLREYHESGALHMAKAAKKPAKKKTAKKKPTKKGMDRGVSHPKKAKAQRKLRKQPDITPQPVQPARKVEAELMDTPKVIQSESPSGEPADTKNDDEPYEYVRALRDGPNLSWTWQVKGLPIPGGQAHDEDISDWSNQDVIDLTRRMLELPDDFEVEVLDA